MDSGSTDSTLQIVASHGRTAVHREFVSSPDQVNWGLDQLVDHEWVLILDSDEAIEFTLEALRLELGVASAQGCDAIALRRRNILFGRWIRHGGWYPDLQTRVVKSSARYRYVGQVVHQHLPVPRKRLHLSPLTLRHDTYQGIDEYWLKLLRHTRHERSQAYRWGSTDGRPRGAWAKTLSRKVPGRFWVHLVYRYILRAGFLDGRLGWHLALWSAVYQDVLSARREIESEPIASSQDGAS